ncbi:MAG: type II toxin-antitoxin system PemK/MazF family toxin [Candidatus Obscuribacterales bacterium]|nr:type II toxin-antitoxin system PemK/MazF family toxin [Candidatus Obscuribacterales bacterium]
MSAKPPVYRKGDVVLVAFPYTTDDGQTQTKRRPAVIISNDYNNARLDDVLLVPLTSNVTRATREPTQVVVEMATPEGKLGGIRLDSVIDCTVIATIPKTLLVNKIGAFPNEVMERVDMCLMIALSIGRPIQPDQKAEGDGDAPADSAKSDESKDVEKTSMENADSKSQKQDSIDSSANESKPAEAKKPEQKSVFKSFKLRSDDDRGPKK